MKQPFCTIFFFVCVCVSYSNNKQWLQPQISTSIFPTALSFQVSGHSILSQLLLEQFSRVIFINLHSHNITTLNWDAFMNKCIIDTWIDQLDKQIIQPVQIQKQRYTHFCLDNSLNFGHLATLRKASSSNQNTLTFS